jgi:hypothetical protein
MTNSGVGSLSRCVKSILRIRHCILSDGALAALIAARVVVLTAADARQRRVNILVQVRGCNSRLTRYAFA